MITRNPVLTCLAAISTVPPRLTNLGGILAPDRQRPFAPSQVPLPIFEPIRWQLSEWRPLFEPPLGKESLHHETSANNAGLGRDDVELDRLLLLVALEWLR